MTGPSPIEQIVTAAEQVQKLPPSTARKQGRTLIGLAADLVEEHPEHADLATAALKDSLGKDEILPQQPDKPK